VYRRAVLEVARPAARLLPVTLAGPAGSLEGLLRLPEEVRGAAVFAHPHPQHGGTLHTKVVHRAARLLADRFSLASLRFNFRGVGASEGRYDEGRGETEDLVAAGRFVREKYPEGPMVLGGFSFGSICALRAARVLSPDVLFLVGVPLNAFAGEARPYGGVAWNELESGVSCPVVWAHGGRDEYGEARRAQEIAQRKGWRLVPVPPADHFFTGHLDDLERQAADALGELLPSPR